MRGDIIERLRRAVAGELGVDENKISVVETVKDNGVLFTGFSIADGKIHPVFYLDDYIDMIEDGLLSVEEAAEPIADCLKAKIPGNLVLDVDTLRNMSKEEFLSGIKIRLLCAERNEDLKGSNPYVDYMDLIGLFYYRINGEMSIRVTNKLARHYGVTTEDLMSAGLKNTDKDKKIIPMADVMEGLCPGSVEQGTFGTPFPMYVMTNSDMYLGASVMLLPGTFEELATKLESDLWILPSSKHEVLALPQDEQDPADLMGMVREINGSSVISDDDFLSNSVYQYRRGSGIIEVVS